MLRRLALLWFRLTGWKIVGRLPEVPKYVVIGAPHTSNWDFVVLLAGMTALGIRASFMAKHTLFRWPFGRLMRRLGGIPIRRHVRQSAVEQMAAVFDAADSLILVLAPEGTRSHGEAWKSGFYHIARTAGVPIVLAALDFAGKRAVIGPILSPSGDVRADMDEIRAFYAGIEGKRPERAAEVRLAEEGQDAGPSVPVTPRS